MLTKCFFENQCELSIILGNDFDAFGIKLFSFSPPHSTVEDAGGEGDYCDYLCSALYLIKWLFCMDL